jgi:hypothetical protein
MARIRTVKPDFFRHEKLQDLEVKNPGLYIMLVFQGLWTLCDSKGKFIFKPRTIKLDILPFIPFDIDRTLSILIDNSFIDKYTVEGKDYGRIPSFNEHQRLTGKELSEGEKYPDPTTTDPVIKGESPEKQEGSTWEAPEKHQGAQEGKGKGKGNEHIHLYACVCEIFGREYKPPPERMPALANWYTTIEEQAEKLLEVWPEDVAIRQVKAYLKHCEATNRKKIGNNWKVYETLISADWISLSAPDAVPKSKDPYEEASYNLTLWTPAAWMEHYALKIKNDPAFREKFKNVLDEKLRNDRAVAGNPEYG